VNVGVVGQEAGHEMAAKPLGAGDRLGEQRRGVNWSTGALRCKYPIEAHAEQDVIA